MAMVGVFAHAYVGNHGEPRHVFLDFTNRALDLAVVVPGLAALRVLALRNPEQDDGGHTGGIGLASLARDMVDRHLRHARHRADRLLDVASGADEVGLDKILGCEPRLADHAAERLVASQSSRPIYWKCHRRLPLGAEGPCSTHYIRTRYPGKCQLPPPRPRGDQSKLADKLWEVAFDGVPQELEVNVVIFVNQLLPHTNNSCPRDLGIVFSLYSGDSIRRFADDCVPRTHEWRCDAAQEMRVGLSKPAVRRRLQ